ncbi:MAG: hypothetical protein EOO98_11565 [Pedobacter sp.]|nr:MAG: hypothetical protein EOO98_11565 [Pedobacter sp.]
MKRTVGNNEWLDIDVLDDYLEGKLDASMMHKVERISLDDPFVAQALAGLTEAKKRTQTLSILQKQLQERVAEKPVERKRFRIASHRLSIAATAAVLFITVGVLFWFRENNRRQLAELAANQPKSIQIDLKPEAAAVAPIDTLAKANTATALLDQKKVEQALNNTLAKGNQAIAKNNTVKAEAFNAKQVKGLVLDVNGRPIPGAEIKMVGADLRAITNVSGEFTMPANKDSNKVTLEVASLGFARKNVEAKTNEQLNIRLEESNNALSEVVVTGYGEAKKKSAVAAKGVADEVIIGIPEIGWKAYAAYLQKSNKLYVDGTKAVILGFKILADGTPSDIKVSKSEGKAVDEEAIRLLKNGGKWKLPTVTKTQTSISIKF